MTNREFEPQDEIRPTTPTDDAQALKLAEELVAACRPELSRAEQYATALALAHPVKVIENYKASLIQLGEATDKAVRGDHG